jgi:hypothetical protein
VWGGCAVTSKLPRHVDRGGSVVIRRSRLTVVPVPKDWFYNPHISLNAKGFLAAFACIEDDEGEVSIERLAQVCGVELSVATALLVETEAAGCLVTGEAAARVVAEQATEQARALAALEAARAAPKRAAAGSVVYYLRRADGAIKIGFSVKLRSRMSSLAELHGPLELLGTEPGGWHHEHHRHEQFARLRIHRNQEWFTPGPALLRHISGLAGCVPVPSATTAEE